VNTEENFEQLTVANLFRIKRDLYRLGMTRLTTTDPFIGRVGDMPTGISGHDIFYTLDLIVHRFQTPKASTG
jgi:hypothetical protein